MPSRLRPTWRAAASTYCLAATPKDLALEALLGEGLDPTSDEGLARYDQLLAKHKEQCAAEGNQVRDLGGLYVIGSERHEARRVDDQLRGRSGRQGDPGESRFYLSLEDELMRLFAQGMLQWAMGRFPEDLPIENRMVTKAIERAQHNVEIRNGEIRKDVLKYDEVMNEQRKVIYARRIQVMEGEDLRQRTLDVITSAIDSIIRAHCPSDFHEEWDLDGLLTETRLYFPTQQSIDALKRCTVPTPFMKRSWAKPSSITKSASSRCPGALRASPRRRCASWNARSCSSSSTSAGGSTFRRWTT